MQPTCKIICTKIVVIFNTGNLFVTISPVVYSLFYVIFL